MHALIGTVSTVKPKILLDNAVIILFCQGCTLFLDDRIECVHVWCPIRTSECNPLLAVSRYAIRGYILNLFVYIEDCTVR